VVEVIGVLTQQATSDSTRRRGGGEPEQPGNRPAEYGNAAVRGLDQLFEDEIDGMYMKVKPGVDSIQTANVVKALLSFTHKDAAISRSLCRRACWSRRSRRS